jgi:hypothetical protein
MLLEKNASARWLFAWVKRIGSNKRGLLQELSAVRFAAGLHKTLVNSEQFDSYSQF